MPMVDEEYAEEAAVHEAVQRAQGGFVAAPADCAGIAVVARLNALSQHVTAVCEKATAAVVAGFAAKWGVVDVVDIDIQSHELELKLVRAAEFVATAQRAVRRLIIGTHTALRTRAMGARPGMAPSIKCPKGWVRMHGRVHGRRNIPNCYNTHASLRALW
eukprot:gene38918-33960_t